MVHQSSAQYRVIRSTINYVYILTRVQMTEIMKRELSTFIVGMERIIIAEKQIIGIKFSEEKNISFEEYELLAKTLFESREKRNIFSHPFLVLDWCLMKRAENCVNSKINHIHFHGDCLVFEFKNYKGHPKGEKNLGPCRVYTNPSKMWLCPVLSLSRYLFCYPNVLKGDVPLFRGKSQYTQYATWLTNLVKILDIQLKIIIFEAGYLGSHSCCKGVATMVSAGCTVYPPISVIFIWAGCILGGVKNKYLYRENTGDQYFGCCFSYLDQLKIHFQFPHHILILQNYVELICYILIGKFVSS